MVLVAFPAASSSIQVLSTATARLLPAGPSSRLKPARSRQSIGWAFASLASWQLQLSSGLLPKRSFAAMSSIGARPAPACASGKEMLQLQRWAVVGRGSNDIVVRLQEHLRSRGREVHHVDPYGASGPSVPKSLADLPEDVTVDAVDLCARPDLGEVVIEDCKKLGVANVFVQPGAGSSRLEELCREAGIILHNGCVLVEL
ncbi:unnamed protein product [Polarella glacialis]|uniref:CoA-binding domain-containing protein n=1 Tax=Polarella glacialis TaxID=89957 RepID=A0A813LJ99_POLGL|nr:unnamed protein product [Polarella glacialis]|mmetsp:Transcript_26774/g.42950  ORF Transcript_26774/g.42950 Transcript_26774/m.42950 type:complete len:201 (+) Transcript_26774:39-641(+)